MPSWLKIILGQKQETNTPEKPTLPVVDDYIELCEVIEKQQKTIQALQIQIKSIGDQEKWRAEEITNLRRANGIYRNQLNKITTDELRNTYNLINAAVAQIKPFLTQKED